MFKWLKKASLNEILAVFIDAKEALEAFIENNQKDLDDLNDKLIEATRNHSKAKSTLTHIKKITGDSNEVSASN